MDALKTKMRQINVKPFVDIMSLPTKLSAVPSCFGVSYLHSLAVCWEKTAEIPTRTPILLPVKENNGKH